MPNVQSSNVQLGIPAGQQFASRLRIPSIDACVAGILCSAVLFNSVLAFLNSNFLEMSRGDVILVEIIIVAAALIICIVSANRLMIPWFGILWILAIILIATSVVRQSIEVKHYRDVMLVPLFIALGTTFAERNIFKLFFVLQSVIIAVMLFEAISPEAFARVFNPWLYFVTTRDFDIDDSWHSNSGLYLSAIRPHGRYILDSLEIHRLSSVFLEPVSLGNWCVIVAIFVATFWRQMSWRARAFFVISDILLIVGSDGRLAFAACTFVLLLPLLAPRLPKYIYCLYLPGAILVAVTLVAIFHLEPIADDFPGRIAKSIEVLMMIDLPAVLGIDHSLVPRTADSGISYIIVTQSIFGIVVLWAAICLLQPPINPSVLVFMHGTCAYVSMVLMIGGDALFTIKTAAPIWFLYGYVRAKGYLSNQTDQR